MIMAEDVLFEVKRLFGEDAGEVDIFPCGRGFEVVAGSSDCIISDWSDMDLLETLLYNFLVEKCRK